MCNRGGTLTSPRGDEIPSLPYVSVVVEVHGRGGSPQKADSSSGRSPLWICVCLSSDSVRRECPLSGSNALPTREFVKAILTVVGFDTRMIWPVCRRACRVGLLRRNRSLTTISQNCPISRGRENRPPYRNRNLMLAGTLVVFIGRALTPGRHSVSDRNEIFVIVGIRVTAVANPHTRWCDRELEGFVLCSFRDATRKFESGEWMVRFRHCLSANACRRPPHPSRGDRISCGSSEWVDQNRNLHFRNHELRNHDF